MADTITFTRGVPPPEAFPTDVLSSCFEATLRDDFAVVLHYDQQPGYAPLRRELARTASAKKRCWSATVRCSCRICSWHTSSGSSVLTEQPSYDRALTTFRSRGAQALGVLLEEDGIAIERLEAALNHEADGATLSPRRRGVG